MNERSAAIIIRDGKILFMRRVKAGNEYYIIPGGSIEPRETPEAAAVRELEEEFGLAVELDRLLFTTAREGKRAYHFLAKSYAGTPVLGGIEREIMTPENQFHVAWMPLADIAAAVVFPEEVKERLLDLLSYLRDHETRHRDS